MRRLLFAALTAVAVVACNNLHLTEGNAYPCDFSQPPDQRDTPCLGTDVCSINNVCVAYVNEGPRFEGGPSGTLYAQLVIVTTQSVTCQPCSPLRSVSRTYRSMCSEKLASVL